jgi:hypothetical protein
MSDFWSDAILDFMKKSKESEEKQAVADERRSKFGLIAPSSTGSKDSQTRVFDDFLKTNLFKEGDDEHETS